MSKDSEITTQIAIDAFEKLIAARREQLRNTPFFLEEERAGLEMEIGCYERQLREIREVAK